MPPPVMNNTAIAASILYDITIDASKVKQFYNNTKEMDQLPEGVSMKKLLDVYAKQQAYNKQRVEKRREFLTTEEGKKFNRENSKKYYEKNKEKVKEKVLERYYAKKALKELEAE